MRIKRTKVYHNDELLSGNCPFTGYCFDETLLDELRTFVKHPDNRTYQELMNDCLAQWAKTYRDDWEYQYSDEAVIDAITANEYEFTEEGVRA